LGAIAARRLGVTDVARRPAVLIDDVPFVVVGVLDSADTRPDLLADAMLPRSTSVATWGQPSPGGDSALAFICQIVGAVGIANTNVGRGLRTDRGAGAAPVRWARNGDISLPTSSPSRPPSG